MAVDLWIRNVSATEHPSQGERWNARRFKRGDVISVMPAGHPLSEWSFGTGHYVVVRSTLVDIEDVREFFEGRKADLALVVPKRFFRFDVDALIADPRMTVLPNEPGIGTVYVLPTPKAATLKTLRDNCTATTTKPAVD